MLRALAQLGVIHQPDFVDDVATPDTYGQLSRSPTSAETLERHGAALVLAMLGEKGNDVSPEQAHVALHGGRETGALVLQEFVRIREGS